MGLGGHQEACGGHWSGVRLQIDTCDAAGEFHETLSELLAIVFGGDLLLQAPL